MNNNEHGWKGDGSGMNMFYGATPEIFVRAAELKANMTPAEKKMWGVLKINEWHLKFRRQHPVSLYIADFYCHGVKLVIELDGGYHLAKDVKIYDAAKEEEIKQLGITMLRFTNEEVITDIKSVLKKIVETIHNIRQSQGEKAGSPNNSPSGDGGKKLTVIKIGGNVIDNDTELHRFLKNLASIEGKKILVHGGGKIATKMGEQLGLKPQYVNGRRITDAATLELVTMVYGGLINKKIVAVLQSYGCNAIGLTGADANVLQAVKRPVEDIDYGFAGDIMSDGLETDQLRLFLENGLTPVLAPLTHDGNGQMLNTNADTIASVVAVALSEEYDVRLIYCFEKPGILENVDDDTSVISLITKDKYAAMLAEGKLIDGILPKIDNAFSAIRNGVKEVIIGNSDDLLQNTTDHVKGTLIKNG